MAQPSDFEYLAIEGGGGKGLAYSGGIRVLQKAGLIPLTNEKSFKGISGASAGAITAFFISLGMTAEEIDKEVAKNKFKDFFEEPHPGVYKGIKVNNNKAIVGYVTDEFNTRPDGHIIDPKFRVLHDIVIGKNFFDQSEKEEALEQGKKNYNKMRYRTLIKTIRPYIFEFLENTLVKESDNPIVTKIKEKKGNADLYFSSLFMDRGLFSGISIREYFQKLAYDMLKEHYSNRPAFAEIELRLRTYQVEGEDPDYGLLNSLLTFNKLYEITGKTLHITATNMSQCKPVIFCTSPDKLVGATWSEGNDSFVGGSRSEADTQWDTGDFPVIEAICCSMNIPFVFKTVYVNYFAPNGKNYNGLYGDGGILYNTPIHIWDGGPLEPLNPKTLGLRVNDGYDPSDNTFEKSKHWRDYIYKYKLAKVPKAQFPAEYRKLLIQIEAQQKPDSSINNAQKFELHKDTPGGLFDIFKTLVGYMFGLLFYWPEEGQLRIPDERKQTVLFYSYDVTILDFAPPDSLKQFLAQRAQEKLAAHLGVKME
jgi:predicted acylesterase/phospholipase RssA